MKQIIRITIMMLLAAVIAVSSFQILRYFIQAKKQINEFEELSRVVENVGSNAAQQPESAAEEILPEYAELYQQNSDIVGWLRIEDTNINYPVMQTPDDQDYYLKRNFNKEYSDYGVPFVAKECDLQLPSDNIIIYGHNMKNGTMFADLLKFKDEGFYQNHRSITFDTIMEYGTYEILAVFLTVVYTDSPETFKYYQFINAATQQEFDEYIKKCKEISLYETGVDAQYGDKLVTLSTCEYSRTNGRIVVVARRIEQ